MVVGCLLPARRADGCAFAGAETLTSQTGSDTNAAAACAGSAAARDKQFQPAAARLRWHGCPLPSGIAERRPGICFNRRFDEHPGRNRRAGILRDLGVSGLRQLQEFRLGWRLCREALSAALSGLCRCHPDLRLCCADHQSSDARESLGRSALYRMESDLRQLHGAEPARRFCREHRHGSQRRFVDAQDRGHVLSCPAVARMASAICGQVCVGGLHPDLCRG